jgi:protein ImuB
LQAEVCAGAVLRKRSLAEEDSAHAALLACAATFSPRVESTAPGIAILDLNGTDKHWLQKRAAQTTLRPNDAPDTLWRRAAEIMTTKTTATGFNLRIAIASNPDTAFLAARGFFENKIIPAGDEARQLSSLPSNALPLSPEMLSTIESWGIRTFQSLAALPEVDIVIRLGQEGLYLQQLARGAVVRPLLTFEANAEFAASFEFDDPVETLESLFLVLSRLLHELCSRLISTAQAASELRLTIRLNVRQLAPLRGREEHERQRTQRETLAAVLREPSDESKDLCERVWELPTPTQDKNLLFNLLRLHLEKTSFSAPVRSLRLEAVPVKPRHAQGNIFAPPSPEPERLELTLERIRRIVGTTYDSADRVGSPRLLDTHKPGSFAIQRFSSVLEANSPARKNFPSDDAQPLCKQSPMFSALQHAPLPALRLFRPAIEAAVELTDARPHFVQLWHRHRRVLAASGPWSSSGNWWNTVAWAREEWDVVLQTPAGLGVYRIYRDRLRSQWFVEGVFD